MLVKAHGGISWAEAPASASASWSCTGLVLVLLAVAVSGAALGGDHGHKSNESATTQAPLPSVGSPQHEARMSKTYRRMILPLLVGVLLKVASLLPVILGKLALIAVGSIITSKLALLIAALLAIHKYRYQADPVLPAPTTEDPQALYPYRRHG